MTLLRRCSFAATGLFASFVGLLAPSATHAVEPIADWQALQQALLTEVVDGDTERATRTWQTLVRTLASDDDIRGEALFWLGRAQLRDGDLPAARETLRECVRASVARNYCLELLGRLEQEDTAIRSVPAHIDFTDGLQGFVHPWRFAEKGTLRVESSTPPARLIWSTNLAIRREDELHLGLDAAGFSPREVAIRFTVQQGEAWLLPEVVDTHGRRYGWSPDPTHVTGPTTLTLTFAAARPLDVDHPPLNPRIIDAVIVRDLTALLSPRDAIQEITVFEAFIK